MRQQDPVRVLSLLVNATRGYARRAAAATLLATLCAAPAWSGPVRFAIEPDTLRADAEGMWHASVTLENGGDTGVYVDSLRLTQLSLDADSSLTPRHATRSLEAFVRIMPPAGAGEATGFEWTAPSEFTQGWLRFTIHAHDAHHQPIVLESMAHVVGSDLDDANPSRVVGTPGTEVIVLAADSTARPAAAVVVVLAPGVPARSQLRWARTLHQRGYAVALVSAPGWGRSRGSDDRSGPADLAAAEAGIVTAAREPGIDPKRIALWGHGRGGTTALLSAVRHPELAAVVAVDASLDPACEYATLKGDELALFIRQAGRTRSTWKSRSPVGQAERIMAPVLVVQTDEAAIVDPAPAMEFAARRSAAKLFIESRITGRESNPIRRRDGQRLALDFLARRTGKSGK